MTVIFEITDASGVSHIGSVQGSGGALGGGASHRGHVHERDAAQRQLTQILHHVNRYGKMPPGIASRKDGCCMMFPRNESDLTHAEVTAAIRDVQLADATFRIIN